MHTPRSPSSPSVHVRHTTHGCSSDCGGGGATMVVVVAAASAAGGDTSAAGGAAVASAAAVRARVHTPGSYCAKARRKGMAATQAAHTKPS